MGMPDREFLVAFSHSPPADLDSGSTAHLRRSSGRWLESQRRRYGQERPKNEKHETNFTLRLTITLTTRLVAAFLGGGLVVSKLGRRAIGPHHF